MNGNVLKILATATPPTVMIAVLGFMGNGMVTNEKANDLQHIEIRREQVIADVLVRDKMDDVKDIVYGMSQKQAVMIDRQGTIVDTLKRIERGRLNP